jgi:hypothetical protein
LEHEAHLSFGCIFSHQNSNTEELDLIKGNKIPTHSVALPKENMPE